MKFSKFYICSKDGKSNCVIRSLCKILNKKPNPAKTISTKIIIKIVINNIVSANILLIKEGYVLFIFMR